MVGATRVNVQCTKDWCGESETGKVPEDTGGRLYVLPSVGDRVNVEASLTEMIRHTSQVINECTFKL